MRTPYQVIYGFEDVTANFEALQSQFAPPVGNAAPINPVPGQQYFDATRDAAGLPALGYWSPTSSSWTYV